MDAGCYCAHSLRFFPGYSRPQVGPKCNGIHAVAYLAALTSHLPENGRITATLAYRAAAQLPQLPCTRT